MRARASVFVLAVVLAAVAYALVSCPAPKKQEHPTPSPGATVIRPALVDPAAGAEREEEQPLLKAAGHIFRGTVVEAKTLGPIEGARVALLGQDPRAAAIAEGITRSDGSYALESGDARVTAVEVRRTRFLPQRPGVYGEPEEKYDFELERGRALRGRVRFRDGTAVGSGKVFILETGDVRSSGVPFPVARDGTFEAAAEGEDVVILAVGDAFQPGASGVIDLRSEEQSELVIQVEPGRSVTGIVEDGEGGPISGARVEASLSCPALELMDGFTRPDKSDPSTLTDAAGRFTLGGFGSEPARIHVRAAGFEQQAADEEGGSFRITLELEAVEPTRKMMVSVSEIPEGAPLPPRAYLGAKSFHREMKIEGSRYTLADFRTEAGKGWVQVPGFARIPVEWPEGTDDHDLGEIHLERGKALEISVVDAKRRGVPRARVLLDPDFGSCDYYDGLEDVPFETDAEGILLLGGLWKDGHGLWISKPGYISKQIWFDVEDGDVTILLDEEAVLKGRALGAGGEPTVRAGIAFRLDDRNTVRDTTDWTGAFLVRVPAGRDLRGILVATHAAPTPSQVAALAPGERRDLGDIAALPGETLRGRATDEEGTGLPLQSVTIRPLTDRAKDDDLARCLPDRLETTTDSEGWFEIRGLLSGQYTLSLFVGDGFSHEREVRIPHPGTYVFALADPERQIYAGIVRAADGSPAQGASVSLYSRESRDDRFDPRVYIGADGRFKFRGIPQDLFLPVASVSQGLLSAEFEAETVSELPTELVLERGCELLIEVEDEDKGKAAPVSCSLELSKASGEYMDTLVSERDGVIRSSKVPVGSLQGVIMAYRYLPAKIDIETRTDRTFKGTVALRKAPPSMLRTFLVTDPDGRPLEGVWIRSDRLFRYVHSLRERSTDADGRAKLDLIPHPDNGVTLSKSGWCPVRLSSLDIGDGRESEVVLRPSGGIQAHVSIPGDHGDVEYSLQPEPVEVPRWDDRITGAASTIITKPGKYGRGDLPAGRYALLVLSRGGSGEPWIVAREEVTVTDGRKTEVQLELPTHFRIQGRVTSAGQPLAGKPFVLSTVKDGREYRLRGKLDEAGRFSRSACVPGIYTVSVGDGGRLRRVATVEITGEIDLALEIER